MDRKRFPTMREHIGSTANLWWFTNRRGYFPNHEEMATRVIFPVFAKNTRIVACRKPQNYGISFPLAQLCDGILTEIIFNGEPLGLRIALEALEQNIPCIVLVNSRLHYYGSNICSHFPALESSGISIFDLAAEHIETAHAELCRRVLYRQLIEDSDRGISIRRLSGQMETEKRRRKRRRIA